MRGKVHLIAAVAACVSLTSAGVPVSAQQAQPQQAQPEVAAQNALQVPRVGLSSIPGTAVNWTNTPLVNAPLRLRDARYGRIVGSAVSDRFGAFEFRGLQPGSYVVELMNASMEVVLATSPIVNLGTGDTVATLVKLPYKQSPLSGLGGLSTALVIGAAAAAAGVLATTVAGEPATNRAVPGQR
jgi:hypothetical protein